MTKKEMLQYIEKSGMVIDFSYNYLYRRDKNYIINLYNRAIKYNERKKEGIK